MKITIFCIQKALVSSCIFVIKLYKYNTLTSTINVYYRITIFFFSFSFLNDNNIHFLLGQLKFINLITFYFLNCNSNAKKVYKLGTYLKIEYSFSNHREYQLTAIWCIIRLQNLKNNINNCFPFINLYSSVPS